MKKTIALFLAALTLAACKNEKQSEKDVATKVETTQVKTIQTKGSLHYSGTIEASQTIPLSFQAAGTVLQVFVNEGDAVKKGQVLATVDKSDAENMYAVSMAKYQQAKDAYKRLKEVYEQGSLPEIKWVEMQSNLQQAESSVAISKNNLKKCSLTAPDNGIIGKRNIEPGMYSLGNTLSPLELVKIKTVYVKIAVPENEISLIKKGFKAKFKVSALGEQSFEGTITNIGVVADQISRTYEVKISVDNKDEILKPGMVCDLNLNINALKDIVVVDYQAIDKDMNDKNYVYVVDNGTKTVKKRIVQIGNYQNDNIEIRSGLSIGECVVTEGKQKLSNNSKITL